MLREYRDVSCIAGSVAQPLGGRMEARYIHNTGRHCCDDDISNQKHKVNIDSDTNVIDCDSDIDWTKIPEHDLAQYKYWETPSDETIDSTLSKGDNSNAAQNVYDKNKKNDNSSIECKKVLSAYEIHRHLEPSCTQSSVDCEELTSLNAVKTDVTLTHTDSEGRLNMVDVGYKKDSTRVAIATGIIILGEQAYTLVKENKMRKGDVLTVAKIAGINGAKKCSDLIPLCHNIPISKVDVQLDLIEDKFAIKITSLVKTHGKTGVEMEAITAVSIAAVTIYDMCKAVSKDMVIKDIRLFHKSGGKSGEYNWTNS